MSTLERPAPVRTNPYRPWPARITSIVDLTPHEKLFELRIIDPVVREAFAFEAVDRLRARQEVCRLGVEVRRRAELGRRLVQGLGQERRD